MSGEVSQRRLKLSRRMLSISQSLKRKRLRAPSAIIRAAALGVLRPSDLDAFVSETYSSDADFYHPNVRRDIYEERIVEALRGFAPGNRLLDAFCGQGREAKILSAAGFDVTGIDNLSAMIDGARAFAERDGFAADFEEADFDTFEDPNGEGFDVVYTSAWMFSTCPSRERRRAFLEKCASLCKSSGIIVVSYEPLDSSRRFQNFFLNSTARLVSLATMGYRVFENGDRLGEAGLFWHLFSKEAALNEVVSADLNVVHGDYSSDGLLDFLFLERAE